jgi:hypothetical protein
LRQLRVLDVSANEIGTEGIRALLRTTRLPHLTALHCQRNPAWTGDTTPPNPRELAARAARSGQQNIGR